MIWYWWKHCNCINNFYFKSMHIHTLIKLVIQVESTNQFKQFLAQIIWYTCFFIISIQIWNFRWRKRQCMLLPLLHCMHTLSVVHYWAWKCFLVCHERHTWHGFKYGATYNRCIIWKDSVHFFVKCHDCRCLHKIESF